jgi:hypothetical protein
MPPARPGTAEAIRRIAGRLAGASFAMKLD